MTSVSIIKIGLLVEDDSVPFWIAQSIQQLLVAGSASVSLIVRCHSAEPDAGSQSPPLSPPSSDLRYAAYRHYEKFDARLKRRDPAFDSKLALSELLPDVKTVDAGEVQTHDIDILFNTCSSIPDIKLSQYPAYGLWLFCDGDFQNDSDANGTDLFPPNGFRELTSGAPTTSVSLRMISKQKNQAGNYSNHIISSSRHLPDILLLGRQRHNVLMQAASQLPAAVERLHRLGGDQFLEEIAVQCDNKNKEATTAASPGQGYLNNWQTCRQLSQHGLRYVARKLRKLVYFEQWCLLIHYSADNKLCTQLEKFTEIIPPDDRIWADPFVLADESNHNLFHLFIEEAPRDTGRGHISVLTVDAQGNYKDAVPIIKRPYHMSYPFIFEYRNERYMIPETGDNHTIELYRCIEFPHKWEFEKNLMEGTFAVDTTLHLNAADGRWWMFTTLRQNNHTECLDELHLFHADSPLSSDWQAHQQNPVSRDVTVARPAGSLYTSNDDPAGTLYRPSQFGGYHYGWGLNINEVTRLDTQKYEEKTVRVLKPGWRRSAIATHTLNRANGMTVSDVRKLRFRWLAKARAWLK